jgi:FKBP-type peptidyl-prolyl cis-trans isomerase FklB
LQYFYHNHLQIRALIWTYLCVSANFAFPFSQKFGYYMKYFSVLLLSLFLGTLSAQTAPVLKTQKDSASYAFGIKLAQALKRQINVDINNEIFGYALGQALNGATDMIYSVDQANTVYTDYEKAQVMKAGEVARVAGEKFLAENKKRKQVTTTASGLQYEVITKGQGTVKPLATNTVKVHYHGTLIDGSVFDSSVERGQPATFGLNQVISGWTEGLQLMNVGDKFRFYLPYNIAYGERAAGAKIKPFSALIFEVELLEVVK